MSKRLDKLETALGEYNKYHVEIVKLMHSNSDKEDRKTPEYQTMLAGMHALDAVLDEIVTTIKQLDTKTKK